MNYSSDSENPDISYMLEWLLDQKEYCEIQNLAINKGIEDVTNASRILNISPNPGAWSHSDLIKWLKYNFGQILNDNLTTIPPWLNGPTLLHILSPSSIKSSNTTNSTKYDNKGLASLLLCDDTFECQNIVDNIVSELDIWKNVYDIISSKYNLIPKPHESSNEANIKYTVFNTDMGNTVKVPSPMPSVRSAATTDWSEDNKSESGDSGFFGFGIKSPYTPYQNTVVSVKVDENINNATINYNSQGYLDSFEDLLFRPINNNPTNENLTNKNDGNLPKFNRDIDLNNNINSTINEKCKLPTVDHINLTNNFNGDNKNTEYLKFKIETPTNNTNDNNKLITELLGLPNNYFDDSDMANEKKSCNNYNKSKKNNMHLWVFVKELLDNPSTYEQHLKWLDREKGIFRIYNSHEVARLWGIRKNRPAMNYDKLSRSLRQYYKKGIMRKTKRSQRLVYQFVGKYAL